MEPAQHPSRTPILIALLALPPIALDGFLLLIFWLHRTDLAIVSPWDVLPVGIFFLYALSTGWLFFAFRQLAHYGQRCTLVLHVFTTYSVALAVYALGFGYDPFIHQAAERVLAETGAIGLTSPLYIGQYALVALLSLLTGLSVHLIDILLVPVLASIALPLLLLKRWPHEGALFLFLLVAPFFTFTVPYHLALLCLIALLFVGDLLRTNGQWVALIALALVALAIHPLAGIPTAVLAATLLLPRRTPLWIGPATLFGGTAVGLIGAFAIHALRMGGELIPPTRETLVLALTVLFGSPYAAAPDSWLKTVYEGFRFFTPLWIFAGVIGYGIHDGWKRLLTHAPVPLAGGAVIAAIFLAGHVRLPDILPGEQFEFALRLVGLIPLFMLPGVIYAYEKIQPHLRTGGRRAACAIPFGVLAVCQWFLTYPQWNSVAHFSALSMGQDDIQAVYDIERNAHGAPYSVLAYPMMSVAALQAFGFSRERDTAWGSRYFYPIPTGNEPFSLYMELLNTENPHIVLPIVFELLKTDRLYVAVPAEWDPHNIIRGRLEPIADAFWLVEERVFLFLFTAPGLDQS